MLLSWLNRGTRHKTNPRRHPSKPLAKYTPQVMLLEERCVLSGGPGLLLADPVMPEPNPPNATLANVFFIGGGDTGLPPVPVKTLIITNNTNQTIFPILRDANTGMKDGIFYDPIDGHNQEFRGYIGYSDNGNFLGLQAKTSITIQVPLVFWDGANVYFATDGTDIIPASPQAPNPFAYSPTSTRAVVSAPSVVSSTNKNGLVMWYHDSVALTPTPDAPAQLTEFTIRDPYLTRYFNVPSDQGNITLINYDVSYVDNLNLPIAMQATQVPIPNTTEKDDYGWIGATLTYDAMQQQIKNFINNSGNELGSYFDGKGWAYYYNPNLDASGYKIPSGANVFANSPLNDTRSKYDNLLWALSSGGAGPLLTSAGGTADATSMLRVNFPDAPTRDAFFAVLQNGQNNGQEFFARTTDDRNTVLGKVISFAPSPTDPTGTVTLNASPNLSGNYTFEFFRPVSDYVSTRIRDIWYAWAKYYVDTFTGTSVPLAGTIALTTSNWIALNADPMGQVALGMRVSGTGVRPGTTVLGIDKTDPKKIYLSQLPSDTGAGNYTFDPPTAMPYADEATPLNLTFAAGADTAKSKKFAASVYEAMIAEAAIPIPLPPETAPPKLPKSMVLVSTVIGADILHLPNHNDFLGGQVRDLIKSILRGVHDFTDPMFPESTWYPEPSMATGGLTYNAYNLDPYVWFVHKKLGLSGYGFSVDDDTADVGANGTSSLLMVVSGQNGLKNTNEWFPSLPWGQIVAQARITVVDGVALLQLTNATKYQQIRPDDPANAVTGAYVWGQGIPPGTNLKDFGLLNQLTFILSTNKVKPSNGLVKVIFTGKNIPPKEFKREASQPAALMDPWSELDLSWNWDAGHKPKKPALRNR